MFVTATALYLHISALHLSFKDMVSVPKLFTQTGINVCLFCISGLLEQHI